MDLNGVGYGGVYDGAFMDLPVGFGMSLAMNTAAMNGYARLTESQKEELIMRCKAARSKKQMQDIVDSLAPGTDVQEIFEEEKEAFS